jgi:hypothetical protein
LGISTLNNIKINKFEMSEEKTTIGSDEGFNLIPLNQIKNGK